MKSYLYLAIILLVGCASAPKQLSQAVGKWDNPYEENPELAGVIISQYPEGIEPAEPYEGKHPASIWYAFWNGDVISINYGPDGAIYVKSVWEKYLTKDSTIWKDVDFTYGSDPQLKSHPDPRKGQ